MAITTLRSITKNTLKCIIPKAAEEYNTGSTYNVNDYCTYKGILYRCIAPTTQSVNTGDILSTLYFKETTLTDEISNKTTLTYATTAEELAAIGAVAKVNDLVLDATDTSASSIIRVTNAPTARDYQSLITTGAAYDAIDEVKNTYTPQQQIAPDFDSSVAGTSKTFNKGELVWHNNMLYEFTETVVNTNAWNDSKVKAITIGSVINNRDSELSNIIADNYDTTKSYNIGDYVIYSNDLYKCTTANPSGAFITNNWSKTNVKEELISKIDKPTDTALTISGAAADAKAVGDLIYKGRNSAHNTPIITTYFNDISSLMDLRDLPENSWGLALGSILSAIAGPNFPDGILTGSQYYVFEKRRYSPNSGTKSYFIYSTTKATMLGGWATNGQITWMVINKPLDTTLTETNAAAQAKAVGDTIATAISGVEDIIYRSRAHADNEPRVLTRYTGDFTQWTNIRSMPSDTYIIATGTEIMAMMQGHFPWSLGSGSMRVEKYSNSGTDTSVMYKIISFAGTQQYYGWAPNSSTVLQWYHPVYPMHVGRDNDIFRYVYTSFDWTSGEYDSNGDLTGSGYHSQNLRVIAGQTAYLGHRDTNTSHTIYGAFFDAGGRWISNLTRSMMSEATYTSPDAITWSTTNYATIYKFIVPNNAVYLSINKQTDSAYSYRQYISNVLCFPFADTGNIVMHTGDSRYQDKTVCIIGSSNVMIDRLWRTGNMNQYVCGLQEYLIPFFKEIRTLGYSGCTWNDFTSGGETTKGIYNYIVTDNLDISGADIYILWASTNGFSNTTMGTWDSTDTTTYFGALNGVITKILTVNPLAKIYLPTYTGWTESRIPYLEEYEKLYHNRGFEIIDMLGAGISLSRKANFCYDTPPVHMNQYGNLTIGEYIRKKIVG